MHIMLIIWTSSLSSIGELNQMSSLTPYNLYKPSSDCQTTPCLHVTLFSFFSSKQHTKQKKSCPDILK